MNSDRAVIDWLLEGDPSVRWQAMRDLLARPEREWSREREKVAREGWGGRLLEVQDAQGTWRRSIYGKWNGTHYTLLLLRSLGLPQDNERARKGAEILLDAGIQADGGLHYSTRPRPKHSETCITGMALAICAYFGCASERLHSLFDHLLRVQTPDGGWNCQWGRGSKHGSFHTTISVLEGLYEYERRVPEHAAQARSAQAEGREFLLAHRLYRSHTTGNVVKSELTRFSFPPQWHYDVLRGIDYFQAAGAEREARLEDAIEVLRKRRRPDGTWAVQNQYPGQTWFEMEAVGEPSRMNTLRALRVLKWYDQ